MASAGFLRALGIAGWDALEPAILAARFDEVSRLDHALARPVRRVLVVTDGYVGKAEGAAAEAARRRLDLRVLLTPGGWRRDLESVATRFEELPASAGATRRTS